MIHGLVAGFLFAAAFLASCGDDLVPNVAGTWSYDWQVRDDVHWHGALELAQDGADVTGTISYPAELPPDDQALIGAWDWHVAGAFVDGELHLFAPPPDTLFDDGWKFHLTIGDREMSGPEWAGPHDTPKWTFRATR